jgi:hypothetical protein
MDLQVDLRTSYVNLNPNYRGRVRSGCLTCRKKKVKCDEQRPACNRCVRLDRNCVYGVKTSHATEERGRRPGAETSSACRDLLPAAPHHYADSSTALSSSLSTPAENTHAPLQSGEASPCKSPSVSLMTSEDIYLCTTIDWLAANERLQTVSFSYFLDEIDLPVVAAFDPLSWRSMKTYAADLGFRDKATAAAISAVQLLWRAQTHSLPTKNAISQFHVARKLLDIDLQRGEKDLGDSLLNAFLLCLFAMVLMDEIDCIFARSDGDFMENLGSWPLSEHQSIIASHIPAWLKLMQAAARRGGNHGILSPRVNDLIVRQCDGTPVSATATATVNHGPPTAEVTASTAIFNFYLSLQHISLQVASLSHYHRSRTTAADQEEVVRLMARLKAELHSLWLNRPLIMRLEAREIRRRFSPTAAEILINQIATSLASLHAEFIDIDRSLGDPLSKTSEAEHGLCQIEILVRTGHNGNGKLSPGFLRPLFMYAIEHEDSAKTGWAIEQIRGIKDPIARSDFFADYAQALCEEQRMKKRRVTTRWFCYERYGVRPPFL